MREGRDVAKMRKRPNLEDYEKSKSKVLGYAVEFPLDFLANENLKKMKHFEFGLYMVPNHVFT